MCGIIGYIGKQKAQPILMEGLKRLEYRGYDSAGIAVNSGKKINCLKVVGKIFNLEDKLKDSHWQGKVGIAHTRWATHGAPTEENTHPHSDCQGKIFVVHNGIIENYDVLKKKLIKAGHKFKSETDTEVLAHLIEENYKNDLLDAVSRALSYVKGTYGICVISSLKPDEIVAARLGSPLILGIGEDEYFVASDVSAILGYTKQVIYLNDGEIAFLTPKDFKIVDIKNKAVQKEIEEVEWTLEESQKGGFAHFMLKEISEQPEVIENSVRGRLIIKEGLAKLGGLESIDQKLRDIKRIIIVACGTARYAGQVGEYMFEEYAGIPTEVEYGSEFRYRKPILENEVAILAISQSGETADTLAAIREAKRKGALTLGIVNVVGSTIARETDAGVYNHAGPEIAVASTKAMTSQMTALALFTLALGRQRQMSMVMGRRIAESIKNLPLQIREILKQKEKIKKIAQEYKKYSNFLYLGRKYNYPIACEGALKLKELSYIHAEGYAAGEMKHGPIALIDENFPSIFIVPKDSVYEKNISNMEEIKAREGKIIALATEGDKEILRLADEVIYIPKTLEMLTPILSVVPLQLFAYYVAVLRGCDVDKPRNLAKSVTVE
jgi:glucosamine--fructose-6-phosphate aminotransferase (isomerizing)